MEKEDACWWRGRILVVAEEGCFGGLVSSGKNCSYQFFKADSQKQPETARNQLYIETATPRNSYHDGVEIASRRCATHRSNRRRSSWTEDLSAVSPLLGPYWDLIGTLLGPY